MSNKRALPRTRRRLRIEFAGTPAFTVDVSPGGFCTEAMRVLPPGSPVSGRIRVHGRDVEFHGVVAWAKPGDPRLQLRGRMGVKLSHPAAPYLELFGPPA
ncbi:MAG: PilZ domain-containing protein [Myxococcaceae bacterium]|nr:PilZ domain-containing protein [Myxococcaceae bacterium]